ncbi:MAG: aminotransferase class V-fold PLP-dependent enzyme [Ferruginibacter sp.]
MQDLEKYFLLKEDITYLNFGSFGACPRPVFEKYQAYQRELEAEPVEFITSLGPRYLEESRKALAAYIHCEADDLVYMTNPSYAVNTIAKSFALRTGDEVLTTDLEYGACDRTWDFYCQKAGATYIKQHINLPLTDKETFVEDLFSGLNKNTKLIFLSHITSSTALRLPVEEVCARARKEGIPVCIDGAHAPGQIPLDLKSLDPEFYTGACHKWMMTAKGSSFLYVKKSWQKTVEPLIVSWGYKAMYPSSSEFLDWHQVNGTRDYSAFLTIPAAIEFMEAHNWPSVAATCRKMVQDNVPALCELLNTKPLSPLTDDFMLQLCSAEIQCGETEKLHDVLLNKFKIQVPVPRHRHKNYLRYSINGFNNQQDLDKLFAALQDIKKTTNLIG